MYANEKERRLAEMPVPKLFVKLAIPAIVGMLVQGFYIIADRYFISQIPEIGEMAMSGVGICMPLWVILFAFAMLIGVGSGANISIYLGKKEKENADKILANAVFLSIVFSISLIIIFTIFLEDLLRLYGATDLNIGYAKEYLGILVFGTLFNFLAFSMSNMVRAEGNPSYSMFVMITSSVLNVCLDFIFIRYFNLGVKGAAYATVISQFVSFSLFLYYYLSSKSIIHLKKENLRFEKEYVYHILRIGSAPFLLQLAGSVSGGLLTNSLKHYGGEMGQSTYAIASATATMFLMPGFGMNQAIQPIIGYNYGAKNYDRLKKAVHVGIISVFSLFTVATAVSFFFSRNIVSLMADSDELLNLSSDGLKYFVLLLPFFAFTVVGTTFYQSMGKARTSMLVSLTRQVIVLIPCILIMPLFMGLNGVFMAVALADCIAGLIAAFLIYRGFKEIDREEVIGEENNVTCN